MEAFIDEIKNMTIEYGVEATDLDVSLAIELFTDIRNYPSSYTIDMKLADMESNKSKIAMAVIELDAKNGVEGQTAHNENGTNRTYGEKYIKAYENVTGFANIF